MIRGLMFVLLVSGCGGEEKSTIEVMTSPQNTKPVDLNDTKEEVVTISEMDTQETTVSVSNENTDDNKSPVIINGYTLPPEPDLAVNNATLLGIDSNDNGVRDDVEIWILKKYKDEHIVVTEIALQIGRAYQKVLEDPSKAREIYPIVDAASSCEAYYQIYAKYFNEPILVHENINDRSFRKRVFNTEGRKSAYWEYDTLLSGYTYILPKIGEGKKLCDFNTSKVSGTK